VRTPSTNTSRKRSETTSGGGFPRACHYSTYRVHPVRISRILHPVPIFRNTLFRPFSAMVQSRHGFDQCLMLECGRACRVRCERVRLAPSDALRVETKTTGKTFERTTPHTQSRAVSGLQQSRRSCDSEPTSVTTRGEGGPGTSGQGRAAPDPAV
jgi:hypothetical protein